MGRTKYETNKKWQQNNPERVKKYKEDKTLKRQMWFDEIKSHLQCKLCRESHPACIQFHHRNPVEKVADVSVLVQHGHSKEAILSEMAKCDVLCANCHKKTHWRQELTEEERLAREKRYAALQETTRGQINIKRFLCVHEDGRKFVTEHGMAQFCREHGLSRFAMYEAAQVGRRHKGWTVNKIDEKQFSLR